ncbi:MAG: hypothetical protein WCG80_14255 [Spirochaetales bacterium]
MCPFCNADLSHLTEVYRSSKCASCGNDVKICRNCKFYDPSSHWECRETVAEHVLDKDSANFCDGFRFEPTKGPRAGLAAQADLTKKKAAKDAFGSLFKD